MHVDSHNKTKKAQNEAVELEHVDHIAHDVTKGLILHAGLIEVLPIKFLEVAHALILGLVHKNNVLCLKLLPLYLTRVEPLLGVLCWDVEIIIKHNSYVKHMVNTKSQQNCAIESRCTFKEEILLLLH